MKKHMIFAFLIIVTNACRNNDKLQTLVENVDELQQAIAEVNPGDEIVMANGIWTDIRIRFYGMGTSDQPIVLKAQTPGEVKITGMSDLKLGGEYLVVDGLFFKDGASPSNAVIEFAMNDDTLANHSRVTNIAIKDFNKAQRNKQDLWVLFKGRQNQLDHSYLSGKSNRGPTVRVDLEGNQSIKNYHKINNNYFGPRPPRGGPSAETIQLGNSYTSMAPSHTLVKDNFFNRCNGEVEVISSKTNFNEFRNNVFYNSEGSLVTRHGNYCVIDGNYFISDEDSPYVGGIRLIGTGHWVTNNYFYNLRGEIFRAPLALMNGIRRSPLNRYIQVTDVVVAYNTWVNCKSPWQIGVGSNVDQKDVLPPSEIRSETPIRTLVANNVIYNTEADSVPMVRFDSIGGIDFQSNVINNQGEVFKGVSGLEPLNFSIVEIDDNIWVPSQDLNEVEAHKGFEFDKITLDMAGNSREKYDQIGAFGVTDPKKKKLIDTSLYGPNWYDPKEVKVDPVIHSVASIKELETALSNANNGDVIELTSLELEIKSSLKIDRKITIKSVDGSKKTSLKYTGEPGTPAFEMCPKGQLLLKSVILKGSGENFAFATLKEKMSSLYNLKVSDSEISNFDFVLKAYKNSFSEHIDFDSTRISNCGNGLELSAEDDDKGEYNAENIYILNCEFEGIDQNVLDYYRGGYDESTVGGNLVIEGSTFSQCGKIENNDPLINTYGIINVRLANNQFLNNQVKLVARLWGSKNNSESDNILKNSGKIITEQNLPLKLMY